MSGGEVTTLGYANDRSNSLRTTVPASVVRHYKLSKGDKLDWKFKSDKNEVVVVIRPVKNDSQD